MRQRSVKPKKHVSFRPWPKVGELLAELDRFPYVTTTWAVNSTLQMCLPKIIKDLKTIKD